MGKIKLSATFLVAGLIPLFVVSASIAQPLSTDPARFGAMTCQQLWFVEQKTLAEGRVCLKSERAKRAFRRFDRCISSSESILPVKTRSYLEQLRKVARGKGCAGF
ncbi:hypothetical protein [uncultured Roseibium sp.]|uniref:hypothetical protein n=1 Tax=uncultured Roseibium sp. TaxID=1936171 RepID=UPI0026087486|nr:hypothetical protein [uncultured Roseibium sp.]